MSSERRDPVLAETFATIARYPKGRTPREIARDTGLPTGAVDRAIEKLIDRRYVRIARGAPYTLQPQRTPVCVTDDQCVIGVRVLPTRLIGIVTDLSCQLLPLAGLPVERSVGELRDGTGERLAFPSPESVLSAVALLTRELTELVPRGYQSTVGLGVELGGHVDSSRGEVVYSPNLGWYHVPLRDQLTALTNLDVTVENDVNAMAIGEQWFGDGRGVGSFSVVLLGDGIGCGLVIDNNLYHGATGVAGEFGHLVVQPDGGRCRCGRSGCLESVATYPSILRAIAESRRGRHQPVPDTIEQAVGLAQGGDAAALDAFRLAGEALGRAISTLLNLINPERLIVESQNVKATELMWKSAEPVLSHHSFSSAKTDCEIVRKRVPRELGAQGAAAVAISQFVNLRTQ